MRISKKRLEMGEERWAEYQADRKRRKTSKYDNSYLGRLNSFKVKETRRRIKEILMQTKGSKCERCGYDKCSWALHFHHIDKTKKTLEFGNCNLSLETQLKEVEQCELLCANCHAEIHYEENLPVVEQERLEFGSIVHNLRLP